MRCDVRADGFGATAGLVQQYYASLDISKWDDVRKFLAVYGEAMVNLQLQFSGYNSEYAKNTFARLDDYIRRDGFDFRDGRLVSVGTLSTTAKLKEDAIAADAPYLLQQIERIENQIESDPRLAIGTSKELIETVCKTILADRGVTFDRKWELSDLVKCTRAELNLVPDDVPDWPRPPTRFVACSGIRVDHAEPRRTS